MKSTVVPVVDDIGGAEEGIAKNGECVSGDGTEDAGVIVGLLPEEVVVGDGDGGLTKLEVDGALGGGDAAVDAVLTGGTVLLGRGEGLEELVEAGGGQRANGVARVEKEDLGLSLDVYLAAIGLVDGDGVAGGPVAGAAIGRRGGGNDGLLDEGTLELLGVNTTKDGGTAAARDVTKVEGEGTAVDELLRVQVVKDIRVRAVPALQVGANTHDTGGGELGVLSNTESLLVNLGG